MKFQYDTLELRTRHAFTIARAASIPVRRTVRVRIRAGDGLEGWGEAAVSTAYYGETADTALVVLPLLARAAEEATGGDPGAVERIDRAMQDVIGGHAASRTGISAALHDLVARQLGVPVWRMWGLDPTAPVSSFTIGIDEIERMREWVREAAAYPILKIKVGTAKDEQILRMIREEAPDKAVRVDANTTWSARETLRNLPMLEDFGVELLEQPLPPGDREGMRTVARASRIPLVADESCRIAADIPGLAGQFDVVNIKLAKCGSLREGLRMVHTARAHQMRVMLGCMIESTLGVAAAVQLSPLVDYVDLDGAALLANDPFHGPGLESDGRIRFNREPGLGVTER